MKNEMMDRLGRIRIALFDCDGVLTDGTIYVLPDGREFRGFNVRDGYGVRLLHKYGIATGVVSGKGGGSLRARAEILGMRFMILDCSRKEEAVVSIARREGVDVSEILFMGDDLFDIPALELCGFAVTVPDAPDEVKAVVDYVTSRGGGRGAVREVADLLLQAKGVSQPWKTPR